MTSAAPTVHVALPRPAFRALLQRGVGIDHGMCTSLGSFLEDTLGIDRTYVEGQLQTVFLNGKAVDDLDQALVLPGSVLALSGAMPGLVGATMRRGGYYGRMREGITHSPEESPGEDTEEGLVIVKLFNRALADLSDSFASLPLLVPAEALEGLYSGEVRGGWVRLRVTLEG